MLLIPTVRFADEIWELQKNLPKSRREMPTQSHTTRGRAQIGGGEGIESVSIPSVPREEPGQ